MRKTLYTLVVDGFAPQITELTLPWMERYAHKIGAEFYIINQRQYPDMPPVYEKFQLYDLMVERQDDWAFFLDADALVHPDMFDPTEFIGKNTVMHHGVDMANNRFRYNDYMRRDGRHIGSCTWWVLCSDWCRDLWTPLTDMSFNEALDNIFPIQHELVTVVSPTHLIDDYILSTNIARYGLHVKTFFQMMEELKIQGNYFFHLYTESVESKVKLIGETIDSWELSRPRVFDYGSLSGNDGTGRVRHAK